MASNTKEAKETYEKIDFSYKKNALRVTYDIESMPDLFTLAMIHDKALSLMFFGNGQFDDLSDEELISQMRDFAEKESTIEMMNIQKADDLDLHLYRYKQGDKEDMKQFAKDLMAIQTCNRLRKDKQYDEFNTRMVEYCGWNSSRYDMELIILSRIAASSLREKLTPRKLRDLSNFLISFDGNPFAFKYQVVEAFPEILRTAEEYVNQKSIAVYGDGHIDWALLAGGETDSDGALPPGLKKEMARFGMDIIFDESVGDDNSRTWSDEERETLVDYNFNDVLGTRVVGENPVLTGALYSRDIVRELYPYSSAKAADPSKFNKYVPYPRDLTAAQLSGHVLNGPKRIKPVDWNGIKYLFPIPKSPGSEQTEFRDIWEYMKKTEDFIPPYIDDFFSHFRDKDMSTSWNDKKVKEDQPITHASTINIPYYRDGKPLDTYIRASTGGAHGSVYAGLSKFSDSEVREWIRAHANPAKEDKPTIDAKNIVHIDWSSFYPVMASKMQIYRTKENYDRYTDIIEHRFAVKDELKALDKDAHPEKAIELEETQMGLKFILNNATGAGNMKNKFALLPIDNKTLAMRLIGNMHIWCLGQRLSQAGAYVISTNTDGLYVANITKDEAQTVIDGYVRDYGMPVDPEPQARFINRDTSSRVEFENDYHTITKVNGQLAHGQDVTFNDGSIGRNVPYPLIACNAALEYMRRDTEWLFKPYDRKILEDYITETLNNDETPSSAWYHTYVGTSSRRLIVGGKEDQRISRVVLTKNGHSLSALSRRVLSADDSLDVWFQLADNDGSIKFLTDILNPRRDKSDDESKYIYFDGDFSETKVDDISIDFVSKYVDSDGKEIYSPRGYKLEDFKLEKFKQFENEKESKTHDAKRIRKEAAKQIGKPSKSNKECVRNAFESITKNGTMKMLGFYDERKEVWRPFHSWNKGTLTNYTSNCGVTLNTQKALNEFDFKAHIDVDAYVRWAEELLDNWKVTADIPELNFKSREDTVVEKSGKGKRKTKIENEIETLKIIYGLKDNEEESA